MSVPTPSPSSAASPSRPTTTGSDPEPSADPDGAERRRRIALTVIVAVLALVAVSVPAVVIVIGRSSSASFADTEVLDANRLGAARVEIEASGGPAEGGGGGGPTASADEAERAVFSATNLAPGDVVSGHLEVTNIGTAPVRFGLLAFSSGGILADWLRFEAWRGVVPCAAGQEGVRFIEDVQIGLDPIALLDLVPAAGAAVAERDQTLQPGETAIVCIGAVLPLETTNEAQGRSLDLTLRIPVQQVVEG